MTNTQYNSYFDSKTSAVTAFTTGGTQAEAEAYVTAIFQAVLGRDPSAQGLATISAAVVAGTFSKTTFTEHALTDDVTSSAFDYLTADEKTAATTAQDTAKSDAATWEQDNAPVLTLTTASDLVTGTDANDKINALVGTNSANGNLADTFQSVDIIDGGAGTDTLNISIASAGAAVGPTVSNVENINFTGYVNQAYNMANTSGVESITNTSSIVAASFTNVATNTDLTIKNVNNQSTTLSYSASANTTLTDEQNLTLNNVSNNAVVTITGANTVETLNIDSIGSASKVQVGGTAVAGTTKVVVTGDQNLTMSDTDTANAMAAITTVDASAFTGNLIASLTNATAGTYAITGGKGDDTVTIDTFEKTDVINLGEGSDTLVINTNASVTTAASLANIETLSLVAGGAHSLNLAGATELTTIALGATGNTLTLSKLVATADTVNFNAGGVTVDTALSGLSYTLADTTATTDSLTLNYTNKDAQGNLINTTKGAQLTSTVTANKIENVTINTDKLHANSDNTTALTADGGAAVTLVDDSLVNLTIVSETLVDMVDATGLVASTTVHNIDASAANGGVQLDVSAAADSSAARVTADKSLTITTGSGDDYVKDILTTVATSVTTGEGKDTVLLTTTGNDVVKALTINVGAGDDTVTLTDNHAGTAKTTVTLGDGTDTVTLYGSAAGTAADLNTVITDFVAGSAGDKFDLSSNAAVDASGPTTLINVQADDASVAATTGLYILSTDISQGNSATAAQIFASITTTTAGDNDAMYVAYDDGANTYIALVTQNGADGFADDTTTGINEVTHIATLTGVSDATTLNADNFSDFL